MSTHSLKLCLIESLALALVLVIVHALSPAPPVAVAASEWHVCKTGGADFTSIQAAVDAAAANDVIKVAAGVYTESHDAYNLYISKTVHLFGGYTCVDFTTRNITNNVTTIRPTTTIISVVSLVGSFGNGGSFTPTLDGFTITGGGGGNHGGGIRANDSNALIRNNIITGNVGYLLGGGMWVQRGAPRIENNRVENNRVTDGGSGGGVELEDTQATLVGNLIAGNVISDVSGSGGGIYVDGGGPVALSGNRVLSNTAATVATAINNTSGHGGGIYMRGVTATLSNNILQGNVASQNTQLGQGGGLFIADSVATLDGDAIQDNVTSLPLSVFGFGGGVYAYRSTLTLQRTTVQSNMACAALSVGCQGGGLLLVNSRVQMNGGLVADNLAGGSGFGSTAGGIDSFGGDLWMDAVRVQNNRAGVITGTAGGIYIFGRSFTLTNAIVSGNAGQSGAGISASGASVLAVNNTIVGNNGEGITGDQSALTLTNNIIMGNNVGVSVTLGYTPNATFNDYFLNGTNAVGFTPTLTNLFVNPQVDGSWHLLAGSPLIDAGTHLNAPDHDIDGQPRAMIGTSGLYKIDIGADEFTGAAQRQVNLDTTAADLTIIGPGGIQGHPDPNGNNWSGFSVMGNDVNGDGRADLLISAQDWAEDFNTLNATGRLFGLFNFGTRVTGTIDLYTTTPSLNVVSKYPYQHVGQAFASGDLNGDGKRDLIVSANNDDNTKLSWPAVFVLFGGPALSGTRTLSDVSPADFRLRAPGPDYGLFADKNMLAAGDLNGDGKDDLIAGDPLANDGVVTQTGAVFVTFGGASLGATRDLSTTLTDFTLYGPATGAQLSKLAIGRLTNDAQLDLVACTSITAYVLSGPINSGARHLSSTPADIKITGLQAGGVSIMDFNGDGQDDLLLGSGDKIFVLPGPFSGGQAFDVRSRATLTITNIHADVFASGDVLGNSKPDLILGAPGLTPGAVVIPGGMNLSGTLAVEDLMAFSVSGNAIRDVGWDVAAGDLDGDGKSDLILGSIFNSVDNHPPAFERAGKVFVFYGQSSTRALYLPLVRR